MSVYRRHGIYHYDFWFEGRRYKRSTGHTNKKAAENVEAKWKLELLNRKHGLPTRSKMPLFENFADEFLVWAEKNLARNTYLLHEENILVLKRFFNGMRLTEITKPMVEKFKDARRHEERRNADDGSTVSPATGRSPPSSACTTSLTRRTYRFSIQFGE